jgi:hypothetical protein
MYDDVNFIQNFVPSMKHHSLNLSQIIHEIFLCQFLWQLTKLVIMILETNFQQFLSPFNNAYYLWCHWMVKITFSCYLMVHVIFDYHWTMMMISIHIKQWQSCLVTIRQWPSYYHNHFLYEHLSHCFKYLFNCILKIKKNKVVWKKNLQ